MSKSLLHDWEADIEKYSFNVGEMLKVAEDIYNTAYARGQNHVQEQKWIPVTERLPEERKTIIGSDVFIDPSEEVLVQMESGWMHVTRYWGSRERYKNRPWIDLNYPTTDEVIAWMPRPESYKAESEDKE